MFPITLLPEFILSATHAFKGSPGDPPPPPKPPLREDAAAGAAGRLRDIRKRKGFEASILTGGGGSADESVIKKTLLGG